MDTSPKYILMCEKAEEIQKGWEPDKGDWYSLGVNRGRVPTICILKCHWEDCPGCHYEVTELKEECIWLPRQDQLQKMLSEYFAPLQTMCGVIYDFAVSEYGGGFTIDGSMEQLWLAFVMQEKYQEQWNKEKEEWIGNQ